MTDPGLPPIKPRMERTVHQAEIIASQLLQRESTRPSFYAAAKTSLANSRRVLQTKVLKNQSTEYFVLWSLEAASKSIEMAARAWSLGQGTLAEHAVADSERSLAIIPQIRRAQFAENLPDLPLPDPY